MSFEVDQPIFHIIKFCRIERREKEIEKTSTGHTSYGFPGNFHIQEKILKYFKTTFTTRA